MVCTYFYNKQSIKLSYLICFLSVKERRRCQSWVSIIKNELKFNHYLVSVWNECNYFSMNACIRAFILRILNGNVNALLHFVNVNAKWMHFCIQSIQQLYLNAIRHKIIKPLLLFSYVLNFNKSLQFKCISILKIK